MRKTLEHCLQLANNSVVDAELEAIGQGKNMCVADVQKIIVDSLMENGVVVPVRCKDCKNWNVHTINEKNTLGKCVKLSRGMADTWFCALGERRTDA